MLGYYCKILLRIIMYKLIWEFRGSMSKGTAAHHRLHLEEFGDKEGLVNFSTKLEVLNEMHSLAIITVSEQDKEKVVNALSPHKTEKV